MNQKEYRRLEEGEIIRHGDEFDSCSNPMKDAARWVPATCIGEAAPDPSHPAHRQYRRPLTLQDHMKDRFESDMVVISIKDLADAVRRNDA